MSAPAAVDYAQFPPELQAPIKKYEDFIDNRLQPDLQNTLALRDTIYNRISEYLKLKTHIQTIKEQGLEELETKVDLGSNFYAKAFVPDTTYIFVNVGFGFHLQMTLSEADAFIDDKVKHLERLADKHTDEANEIRAKIKMVYGALMEAMNLAK
ncbi:Prefoldin-domain-containing protein [Martensiomyces pterosporus]|nr:Prefoldin-domain-containing protein [Martensiomyces pterosporus]